MQTNIPKQVPFLPGHVFNDPYKQNFHKTQQFNFVDGSVQEKKQNIKEDIDENLIDEMTKSMSQLTFLRERKAPQNDYIPRVQPPWLKYDRKVLRFYGFFQEHVVESRLQNYRIRKVIIYYYLSDESIYITEPRVQNSGIPQGVFLKRQKVPIVVGELGNCYTWKDLNVGINLSIYQRIFHIYSCDSFTSQFYSYMQSPLNPSQAQPSDLFNEFTRTKDAKINPPDTKQYKEYIEVRLGGGHPNDGLKKYLDNDRRVLGFKCLWHDETLEGGFNHYQVNYFLADDKVEVKEERFQNSGKDPFPLLLKKQKLPKVPVHTYYPGMGMTKEEYYCPTDFKIGELVNIFGRKCIVYDCDNFTKTYFKQTHSYDMVPLKVEEGQKKLIQHEVPPYNGYGTPEDSLGSVYSLQPKPPKKDMTKLFTNDQYVLRFEARMISQNRDQNDRKFIISFFCGDDTIQVYQNADKNSGIWGGKFMQRKKHNKDNRYMVDTDFQIGSILSLASYTFQLLKADDFTIQYMKDRQQKFPQINLQSIVNKIRALSTTHSSYQAFLIWILKNIDGQNQKFLSYDQFYKNVSRVIKLTHPECYIVFKTCNENEKLSMKKLFKLLGGA